MAVSEIEEITAHQKALLIKKAPFCSVSAAPGVDGKTKKAYNYFRPTGRSENGDRPDFAAGARENQGADNTGAM